MRRTALFIFFALFFLAVYVRAHAQVGDDALPGQVILTDEQDEYPLGLYLELLEDPGGELTIEEVTSPEYASRFVPNRVEVPNFGFTDSAYWVRLRLRDENPLIDTWLLEIGFENMHFVDLYSPVADGAGFEVRQTGAMRSPSTRDILYPQLVFELKPPKQSEESYYLRFKNGAPMILALTLWKPAAFFAGSLRHSALLVIFLGAMVGLLSYNLFLFISLRNINYLYLVLLLASAAIYEASQTSFLEIYFVPDLYRLKQHAIALSSAGLLISLILFYDTFLSAKMLLPNAHRINLFLLGLAALMGLATFFTTYHNVAVVMSPMVLVISMAIMISVVIAWRRGFRAARFLVIAMMGLLVCLSLFILGRLSIIPISSITENAFRFGFVWMAIGSSLALADRINLLKAETEQANRDLIRSGQRLTQTLEAMPVGVVVYGPDQRPTYINRRTAEILTNPERDLGPHPNLERALPEAMNYYSFRMAGSDQAYPPEKFPVNLALQGEPSHADDIEADLIDWRVQLEAWASPVFDENGNVETAVIAFQDISKRKQAEEALRASEKKFRVIVENVFDGIAFLDRDRQILYVSPSYEQLNGIPAENLIGKSGAGTIHPDDRAYVAETFQKLLEQPGGRVSEEYRIRHQDGSWVWVETRVMNLLDDPHVQAVVLNSRDITTRRQKDAELVAYREHLEQLVEERTAELNAINEQLSEEMAQRMVLEGLLHKRIQWMSTVALARQSIKGTVDLPAVYETLSLEILQLLNAASLFLVQWPERNESVEFLCRPSQHGPEMDSEAIRTSFADGSPLREALKAGEIVVFSADEISTMPEPMRSCLARSDIETLLLAPIVSSDSVTGVLGLVMSLPGKYFSEPQKELISKITLNLANLAQEARFLDQSRALVATEERNRLARDLHDSVTQVLFSASLVAEVLPQIWRRDPGRAMESLEELRRLTRGALAEMRTMLLELRPSAVVRSPLHELLAQLTEATTSRAQLPFRLFIEHVSPLPEDVHAAIYRIAQETLNNVAKHAHASSVTLSFRTLPLPQQQQAMENAVGVRLVIEDDGVGFSPENERVEHLGLGIMRERAADIGADLEIKSRIGEGTRMTLDWCGVSEAEGKE